MTTTTTALPRITSSALSSIILAQSSKPDPSLAIIDVRDEDYIGGHILGSTNVPSATLDDKIPELVRELQNKDTVVFHCALSQQRGPGAALRYLRERELLLCAVPELVRSKGSHPGSKSDGGKDQMAEEDIDEGSEEQKMEGENKGKKDQKVYVLDRGFVGWQEKFGEDVRLTEGYKKELWKDGYWM